jgi:hypothetical protein
MMPGEDREATHERKVGLLSEWSRGIPNVRNINVDMLYYCPACWQSLIWAEEKTTPYDPDEWQRMRYQADHDHCDAMFFRDRGDGTAEIWVYPR